MQNSKWYVTTTDKFMSGWGHARGKINKLIFICDSLQEAETVAANARKILKAGTYTTKHAKYTRN